MKCLPKGTCLQLNNVNYKIDAWIGQGGHCMVYDAHTMDDYSRKVRIKECFPVGTGVLRNGLKAEWLSEGIRKQAMQAFEESYKKQIHLQNNEKLGNYFTKIISGLEKANNTLYFVLSVDFGETFDQNEDRSLQDTLKILIEFTEIIDKYHQEGYLHLDIKPENFLIFSGNHRDEVKLLDADSITLKKDLCNHKVRLPYSEGFAAPEQVLGRVRKISERSDIYSIGVLLFQKIFHRCPNTEDMGIYANYDFPDEILEGYAGGLKNALKDIFSKTITATPNRRYASVKELGNALRFAERLCKKGYIISQEILQMGIFIGREKELVQIHTLLTESKKILFIKGLPGIGKTEFVKKYIEKYRENYDSVVFLRYEQGLKNCIEQIQISNYKDTSYPAKLRKLKKIVNRRTLLVIDNFDVDDDPQFDEFLSLNATILFTTRNDFSYRCGADMAQFELKEMEEAELQKLFICNYKKSIEEEEEENLNRIIQSVDGHTLMVEFIAKQLNETDEDLDAWIEERSYDEELITSTKDGKLTIATINEHLEKLYRIQDLTFEQKKTLVNLYDLANFRNLTKAQYKKYTNCKNYACLNKLIQLGYVKKNLCRELSLHPTLKEQVEKNLRDVMYHQDLMEYVRYIFKNSSDLIEIRQAMNLAERIPIFQVPAEGLDGFIYNLTALEKNEISVADRKNRAKQLAESLWHSWIFMTENPYNTYLLVLDYDFLCKQSVEILKSLFKHNLPKIIFEDQRLSRAQKKEILLKNVCAQLEKMWKHDSTVLNLYYCCLAFYADTFWTTKKKILTEESFAFFKGMLILNKIKHIEDSNLKNLIKTYMVNSDKFESQEYIEILLDMIK